MVFIVEPTFKMFESYLKEVPGRRITRRAWNDKCHYIYWNENTNEYMEHVNGIDTVWFWKGDDWFYAAQNDILATDWYAV
jgi:hypothetical protein